MLLCCHISSFNTKYLIYACLTVHLGCWHFSSISIFPLSQGWSLPRLPFVTSSVHNFYDRICRRSQVAERVAFAGHGIPFLLFADDVVLLAFLNSDLQLALGRFAAECEAAGMTISTSKSEAMVLSREQWIANYGWRESHFPKWRSSSVTGFCSRARGIRSRRLTDGLGLCRQWCGRWSSLLRA